jgi:hypothetical protein
MSARLTQDDLQPVADLIERLQTVQAAMRDMRVENNIADRLYYVRIHESWGATPMVASAPGMPFSLVLQGLAAMERELLAQLQAKDIQIESALPAVEA